MESDIFPTSPESICRNTTDTKWNMNISQRYASFKCCLTDIRIYGEGNFLQVYTSLEHVCRYCIRIIRKYHPFNVPVHIKVTGKQARPTFDKSISVFLQYIRFWNVFLFPFKCFIIIFFILLGIIVNGRENLVFSLCWLKITILCSKDDYQVLFSCHPSILLLDI